MYFPVADVTANPAVPFWAAFIISCFCSISGVSGAFLLLPWQVSFLHYTTPGVSATNQIFNIAACPGGVWRYWREGRLLAPLTWIMVAGTLPGVFAGAFVRLKFLSDNRVFLPFAALVLFYLGIRLLSSLKKKETGRSGKVRAESFTPRKLSFRLGEEKYEVSCPRVFALSVAVGLIGGVYGVGGGAIMSPFLVSIFNLPVRAIAGASLLSTLITSLGGAAAFGWLSLALDSPRGAPDWGLGLLLGAGGFCGMYLGARCQKFIPGRLIKSSLAAVVIFTGILYLYKCFI